MEGSFSSFCPVIDPCLPDLLLFSVKKRVHPEEKQLHFSNTCGFSVAGSAPRELDTSTAAVLFCLVTWSVSLNLLHQFHLLAPGISFTRTSHAIPGWSTSDHKAWKRALNDIHDVTITRSIISPREKGSRGPMQMVSWHRGR